jgi:nicotinate phosphoribosyltransferase
MTNFTARAYNQKRDSFPVQSLLGVDFYKFPMLYFIWENYRDTEVRYETINRNRTVRLPMVVEETTLRKALDFARTLRFTESELTYLFGQQYYGERLFPWEFIEFLRNYQLPPYTLSIKDDEYVLAYEGPWVDVELWETIGLSILTELYAQSLLARMSKTELTVLYARATERLWSKLTALKTRPDLTFSDFGSRRRHSFLWQDFAVGMASEMMGAQFRGTSETLIAMRRNVMPMGTNAHSLQMATMADRFGALYSAGDYAGIRAQQYALLKQWQELYGPALRIILPDTYGSAQFFDGAPEWLAHNWRGVRQDSGDPFVFGNMVLSWYGNHGITDPKQAGKLLIFSDGLDVDTMLALHDAFSSRINVTFGWGTNFTNGFNGLHPSPEKTVPGIEGMLWGDVRWAFSLVCKVVSANGSDAVKLPDNLEKATGPEVARERYMEVFGRGNHEHFAVEV